jgi:hypothetical protein
MLGAKLCAATAGLAHAALCRPFHIGSRRQRAGVSKLCVAKFRRCGKVTHAVCRVPKSVPSFVASEPTRRRMQRVGVGFAADDLTDASIVP